MFFVLWLVFFSSISYSFMWRREWRKKTCKAVLVSMSALHWNVWLYLKSASIMAKLCKTETSAKMNQYWTKNGILIKKKKAERSNVICQTNKKTITVNGWMMAYHICNHSSSYNDTFYAFDKWFCPSNSHAQMPWTIHRYIWHYEICE